LFWTSGQVLMSIPDDLVLIYHRSAMSYTSCILWLFRIRQQTVQDQLYVSKLTDKSD